MGLKAVDLFCGAGGLSRGLVDAGFEIAAAVDSWEIALRSYRASFPHHVALTADVGALTVEDLWEAGVPTELDLVAGGPPCQGFSIQRIGNDIDDRNDLVLAFGHLVTKLHPRAFLMENVPGLLGRRGKHIAQRFIHVMTDGGYDVSYATIDAADFGVPQTRRRVFFVGWDRARLSEFVFPAADVSRKTQSVRQAIGDLPSPPDDFTPLPGDPLHRRIRLSAKNLERLKHVPPGGGFEDLPIALRVNCHKGGAHRIGHRAVYGRLDPDRPAATITARFDSFTRGRFGHPWEHRNITLREGARLQGFPDDHAFFGTQEEIAAQIGNGVPPPLALVFSLALRRHLKGNSVQLTDGQLALPFVTAKQLTVAA